MLEGVLRSLGRVPLVKGLTLASSLLGFSLLGCSKDGGNPVSPSNSNRPPETFIETVSIDKSYRISCGGDGVKIVYRCTDDSRVKRVESKIDDGNWEQIYLGYSNDFKTFEVFVFPDKRNHTIQIRAVDDQNVPDPTPASFDYVYQPDSNSNQTTPIVTTEQKELTTSTVTGAVAFYSDVDKKNIAIRLVDKNGSSLPVASDIKYYSDLEQIVAVSYPKDANYLPSLYIEDRTSTDLAGIKDGIISLVTSTLSETKYGGVSIKLYNDLPNLFQNKTIIPGLLVKKGDWSFNDIRDGNYWLNTTSKILIPYSGGFTTPIALATETSEEMLSKIDDALIFIEAVTGKEIDRDKKVGWYYIPPLNIEVPNLIPFFVDTPTQSFIAPESYSDSRLTSTSPVDTVGIRDYYSDKWDWWSVNAVLDSKYSSIKKYVYHRNDIESFGFTTLTFSSPERAKEFNQQYLGIASRNISNIYYFPSYPELADVYYFRNLPEVPPRDYLVFFFPVKNFWVGMDVLYGTPSLENAGAGMVAEIRRLNP